MWFIIYHIFRTMFAFWLFCAATFSMVASAPAHAGYGRLNIRFIDVHGEWDSNGLKCDIQDGGTPCDPYVIVYIDDIQDFRGPTIWNQENANFDAYYTSRPISEESRITIKLLDNEVYGPSELMGEWSFTPASSIIETTTLEAGNYGKKNTLTIQATWTAVYG